MTQYLSDQACSEAVEASMIALWKCTEKYVQTQEDRSEEEVLTKLSNIMETYCLFDMDNKASSESLCEARQVNATDKTFSNAYEEIMAEKKKSFPDPKSHPKFKSYEKKLKVLRSKGMETPQEDDDLVITQADVNTIDPITKQQMLSPVKNKKCGHSYDKNSITALFQKNNRQRCPYVGCPSQGYFTKDDLEEDYELKQVIQQQRLQQK